MGGHQVDSVVDCIAAAAYASNWRIKLSVVVNEVDKIGDGEMIAAVVAQFAADCAQSFKRFKVRFGIFCEYICTEIMIVER